MTVPITRIEKQSDGSRVVIGPVSDGLLDWDDQIVDPDWAAEKLAQWFNDLDKGGFGATIHQMHSPLLAPAGKGKDLFFEGGVPHVRAKVVEPTAVKLLDEKCYQGFSIGILDPPIFPDAKAKNGRIGAPGAGGFINEVSLVDTPANPRCLFSLAKRAKANAPIEWTHEVQIVEAGQAIPIDQATPEQITKAFVSALSSHLNKRKKGGKKKKKKDWSDYDREREGGAQGSMGGVHVETGPSGTHTTPDEKPRPLGERYQGLDPLNRPKKKGKKGHKKMTDTATKAKKDGGDSKPPSDDGGAKCPTCKGEKTIMEGNRKCPDCNGTGKATPGGDKKKGKALGADDANVVAAQGLAAKAIEAANAAAMAGTVAGAAVSAAVTKSLTKDADDDVDDALDDVAGATGDLVSAQAADDAADGGDDDDVDDAVGDLVGAVSAVAAAQGADEIADVMGKTKKKSKGRKGKKKGKDQMTEIPTGTLPKATKGGFPACDKCGKSHDPAMKCKARKGKGKGKKKKSKLGNGGGGGNAGANRDPNWGESSALPSNAAVMQGGVSKGKKGKKKGLPSVEKRLHDILCPAYTGKALKAAFGAIGKDLPVVEVLAPEYFAAQMAERSRKGKGDIAEAYQALAAATKLSTLKAPTFLELREAAAKGFMDAYPDVHLKPAMINPDDFHRPFLAGATDETSSVTRVPMPDLKDQFGPRDFNRGPLTTNEARPTLSSGTSVAKSGKKKKQGKGTTAGAGNPNSRQFYTNAAKDENQNAMAMLHDHIVSRYPGVCPMEAVQPGTGIDRDGLAGSPAEMQAKGPGVESLPTPAGASGSGTLRPVGKGADKKRKKDKTPEVVGKAAGTAVSDEVVGLVKKSLRKERKRTARREQKLGKRLSRTKRTLTKRSKELQKALAAPNPRSRAHLGTSPANFTPKGVDPEKLIEAKQAAEHIRTLKSRAKDPNSQVAQQAIEELMRTSGSPKQFARIMAADADSE